MFKDIETVAAESSLHLVSSGGTAWSYVEDHPHINPFHYELALENVDNGELEPVGHVDGYRIIQDWSVDSDAELWEEADALDGDVVRYVEALIREIRACGKVFKFAPDLWFTQHTTILRHVEATRGHDSGDLLRQATACLAMMDAPGVMLVDPWPMSTERRSARGKLKGRGHASTLIALGFVRMVGSRFVWAWNHELSENLMAEYAYPKLLKAKQSGKLRRILKDSIASSVYGKVSKDIAKRMDLPDPDDLMTE